MFSRCHLSHTQKRDGLWQRGDDETPGIVHCGNGVQQVKMTCNNCNATSGPLPYKLIREWGIERHHIGWEKVNEPSTYQPCSVRGCGTTPTEQHHFAPRNTFPLDADDWPCLPLCRPHHVEWHQRMDGYRWHRKGTAA